MRRPVPPSRLIQFSAAALALSAALMVRPENIDMRLAGGDPVALAGTVIDVQFLGGASTVAVEVPGHESPLVVSVAGTAGVSPGEQVQLRWAAADGVLLPQEQPS